MSLKWIISIFIYVYLYHRSTEGAKILMLPITSGSHYMTFEQISVALIAKGHEVHSYMDGDCKSTQKIVNMGVTIHTYRNHRFPCYVDNSTITGKYIKTLMSDFNLFTLMDVMKESNEMIRTETEAFLGNPQVFEELRQLQFDLCIVNALFTSQYMHVLPYKLGLPVVSVLAVFDAKAAGLPALPSFTPYINFGKFNNEMNFMERVSNFITTYGLDFFISMRSPGSDSGLVSKYVPEKPYVTLRELEINSILWLVMNDVLLDYPQIRMPHVVDIGGINTRPPKPLPDEFQKLADEAQHGLIVVSFGTFVSSFPAELQQKLADAFKKLKQTVIWRNPNVLPGELGANIHTVKWMPQNDLLAHPNTRAFVTHCGVNGQFEALYNGVPMLGLPIFSDQGYNSMRMAKNGMGINMNLFKSSSQEIFSAIQELLNNDDYSHVIKTRSQMFKDRPLTPIGTAVYWIEHVLKYGSQHLLSPALHFPWYKYYSIDVLCFIFCLAVSFLFVSYNFTKFMCKCCINRLQNKEKQQ